MCVNLAQYLEINFTGEVGDVQVKLAAALKRAEEAEGRAARLALDARDRGNKCDALRKRCHSLKDELRRSKATALHNVYFVQYDVTVSFLAPCFQCKFCSGYRVIFWGNSRI